MSHLTNFNQIYVSINTQAIFQVYGLKWPIWNCEIYSFIFSLIFKQYTRRWGKSGKCLRGYCDVNLLTPISGLLHCTALCFTLLFPSVVLYSECPRQAVNRWPAAREETPVTANLDQAELIFCRCQQAPTLPRLSPPLYPLLHHIIKKTACCLKCFSFLSSRQMQNYVKIWVQVGINA